MRKSNKIKLKKSLFIFCEGETEKCYFEALKEIKRENVNIKIEPFKFGQVGTTITKIQRDLKSIYNKIEADFSLNHSLLKKSNSLIFLLLDADSYSKQEINNIKSIFDSDSYINVLFSNQDFELFILLHLEYFSGTGNNYIDKIKPYFSDYEKGCSIKRRNIHKEIIENGLGVLDINIKKLITMHRGNNHIKDKLPFSEVYEIYKYF